MPDAKPLSGLTVVITRPKAQAEPLGRALRDSGAAVVECPVLEIAPLAASIAPEQLMRASAIIFVSINAVEHGLPVLRDAGSIQAGTFVMAIGNATAAALRNAAIERVVSPQQSIDSEGLLALPQLQQVRGQTIILIRGQSPTGGRTLIEQTLTDRGAIVTVLECYERRGLQPTPAQREALRTELAQAGQCAVMALSVETLDSLLDSVGDQHALKRVPLLVPHPRVGSAAADRGFTRVFEVPMSAPELIPALAALKPQLLRH
ncbi:MAG: uroporphyrinogen-III synthase [Betaproteobacteria bacterium]|nr:uroporphyrinogen-III synthase [Betaproteobacteria bacterium]